VSERSERTTRAERGVGVPASERARGFRGTKSPGQVRIVGILGQLLSSYLLIWAPGTFAMEALTVMPSIGVRGPVAWIELAVHGVVAIACAAGGRMLRIESPAGPAVAAAGVAARAAISLQSLFWTALPRDIAPGTRLPLVLLTCANAVFWLIVIRLLPKGSDPGLTPV
jgi:hypothetical protein